MDPTPLSITSLHTPLGLGWRRHLGLAEDHPFLTLPGTDRHHRSSETAPVDPDRITEAITGHASSLSARQTFVLAGMHLFSGWSEGLAEGVCQGVTSLTGRHQVVIAGASPLPDSLAELAYTRDATAPVEVAEFGRIHRGEDRSTTGWVLCGGWPEAGICNDGWRPSSELEEFVNAACGSSRDLLDILLLTAVSDRGLPAEIVASVADWPLEKVFTVAEKGETLGLLTWTGTLLGPAFPLVADALRCSRSRVQMAAAAVAGDPVARRFGLAAIPAVRAGLDLDGELHESALTALNRAEIAIDVPRWMFLASMFRNHPDPAISRAGSEALNRLAIVRGDAFDPFHESFDVDGNPHEEVYRRLMAMDGVFVGAVVGREDSSRDVFPSDERIERVSRPVLDGILAGLRGDEKAVAESLMELGEWSEVDAVPVWLIALFSGDRNTTLEVELKHWHQPQLAVLVVIRHAAEGRFKLAARRITALLGNDWRNAAPLYRLLALQVASGIDVEQTRHLLAHTGFPRFGQFGSMPASFIRARAELVTGDTARARERALAIWDVAHEYGFLRPFRLFAGDFLTIVGSDGDLSPLASREPVDDDRSIIQLARELEADRFDAERARGCGSELDSLFSQTHADVLIARRCLDDGDNETAAELLSVSEATFSALGAPVDAARARRLLRTADPSLDRGGTFGSDHAGYRGITDREREVLLLVARGLTNKEIAASMHLSVATVKRHVTSLLRRFDLTSRRQLSHIAKEEDRA